MMRYRIYQWIGAVLAAACVLTGPLRAEDNTSTTISSSTRITTDPYYVGQTGTNNTLTITPSGALTNTARVFIGGNPGASNNLVWVNGGLWTNTGSAFQIGSNTNATGGADNELLITAGGKVFTSVGVLIGQTVTGFSNKVVVANASSLFSVNGNLRVGYNGGYGNELIVSNNAQVTELGGSSVFYIGSGPAATSNNTAWVSDDGMLSLGTIAIQLGADNSGSTGNRLIVTNGGTVISGAITVGAVASNNLLQVGGAGAGSTVTSSGFLTIGNTSAGFNQMTVTNATVTTVGATIGTGSSNNTATISAGGTWKVGGLLSLGIGPSTGNVLTIQSGGIVTNAQGLTLGGGSQNSLVITNGGQLWTRTNPAQIGTVGPSNTVLVMGGSSSSASLWDLAGTALNIGKAGSTGNFLMIDGSGGGGGAIVTNVGALASGGTLLIIDGTSNSLVITNGGKLFTSGQVALQGNSGSATLVGGDANSLWDGGGRIIAIGVSAGTTSSYNTVTIGAGGVATNWGGGDGINDLGVTIGRAQAASSLVFSNRLIVTDGGKLFTSTNLFVGYYYGTTSAGGAASSNALLIANGGLVNVQGRLLVGDDSAIAPYAGTASFNSLTITNGGQLFSSGGTIGLGGSHNTATISDGGTWNLLAQSLSVGSGAATGNVLTINGGGMTGGAVVTNVAAGASSLGLTLLGQGNSVLLTNGGKFFTGGQTLVQAYNSTLTIVGGTGSVTSIFDGGGRNISIGQASGGTSASNLVLIGAGGVATNWGGTDASGNALGIEVGWAQNAGESSFSNRLVVTDGGKLFASSNIFIGYYYGNSGSGGSASSNAMVIANHSTVTVSGGVFVGSDSLQAGTGTVSFSSLTITNGGRLFTVNDSFIGRAAQSGSLAVSNVVTVQGGGALWNQGNHDLVIGSGSGASGNSLLVDGFGVAGGASLANGGAVTVGTNSSGNFLVVTNGGNLSGSGVLTVGAGSGANNLLKIDGGAVGSVVSNSAVTLGGGGFNQITMTNATMFSGGSNIGSSSSNNTVTISANATWNLTGNNLNSGLLTATGNVIFVNGGVLTNVASLRAGYSANANQIVITNSGAVYANALVAGLSGGLNNSILINTRGLVEANSISNFVGGNTITNSGGIFQFTTNTPTISQVSFGSIAVTNGTISFRAITNADVFANWTGANHTLTNIAFTGANTFRLNAASNTIANQSYTFNTGLGATNYARLEMINGQTAYRGGNITIGTGGSMLVSNTTALITGVFTNNGSLSFVNANATFTNTVFNNGGWYMDPSTNTFMSNHTVSSDGYIAMTNGDVMIFKNDFINQSTKSNLYNTVGGTFLFNGISLTQTFATAAIDYGPGGDFPTLPGATNDLGGNFNVPSNNFQLGTLEIASGSTVEVASALSLQRGALYLNNLDILGNGLLIISNDVSVYFASSNGWSYASNIVLYDGAELHQLIPEPSVVVLLLTGLGTLIAARRRKRSR